jgi:metal-responsive CopG/Arc/MetJ family transcriptional regulator
MQDPKSLDDAFAAAIARVQVAQPNPIEALFKSAVARAQTGSHYSQQPTKLLRQTKQPKQRLSTGSSITMSEALAAQFDRFCAENAMPRSKAIRRAIYDMMNNPNPPRPKMPKFNQAPKRDVMVSWSMSKDRDALDRICQELGISQSAFLRRAIYMYTKANVSTDKAEATVAAVDGWESLNT